MLRGGKVWTGFGLSVGGVNEDGRGFRGTTVPFDFDLGFGETGGTLMMVGIVALFCSAI